MSDTRFVEGDSFDEIIETSAGLIGLSADIHIVGSHLVLEDLLFYPWEQATPLRIGTGETFRIFRHLRNLAAEAGFSELTVIYHRAGASRRGTIMARTRKLP